MSADPSHRSADAGEHAARLARAQEWAARNSYAAGDFSVDRLREIKGDTTAAVVIPSRDVESTIGRVVEAACDLRERGVLDEVVVIDGASTDRSAAIAAELGAAVHSDDDLMTQFGPSRGKGDAMWRALSVVPSDVVAYVDSDTAAFGDHFIRGLIGPLFEHPEIELVKGAYRRPFTSGGTRIEDGGGRVSELTARPLLNLFYPELSALQQPLSGELAARHAALASIPFMTGYGIEIQMLIDIYNRFGLDAIAQSDLGERVNAHQPLADLGTMAFTVLRAVAMRTGNEQLAADAREYVGYREGAVDIRATAIGERPPLATLRPVGDTARAR